MWKLFRGFLPTVEEGGPPPLKQTEWSRSVLRLIVCDISNFMHVFMDINNGHNWLLIINSDFTIAKCGWSTFRTKKSPTVHLMPKSSWFMSQDEWVISWIKKPSHNDRLQNFCITLMEWECFQLIKLNVCTCIVVCEANISSMISGKLTHAALQSWSVQHHCGNMMCMDDIWMTQCPLAGSVLGWVAQYGPNCELTPQCPSFHDLQLGQHLCGYRCSSQYCTCTCQLQLCPQISSSASYLHLQVNAGIPYILIHVRLHHF